MSGMPDFIIPGTMRSGTTTFYGSLTTHTGIARTSKPEVHYFDVRYHWGDKWYLSMFEPKRGRISGEVSPCYFYHPYVPERIFEAVPNVKLIVLLRNPVDRAYSHYHFSSRVRGEKRGFEQALEEERKELANYEDVLWALTKKSWMREEKAGWKECGWHSYQTRGYYAEQLKWYMDVFPKEHIYVIKSEDYFASPREELNKAVEYLGLPPEKLQIKQDHELRNADTVTSYKPMRVETRQQLIEHFRPHNAALEELLGRDLGWDK